PLELLRDGRRERLEERELRGGRDFLHRTGDLDVVDAVFEPVARPSVPNLELDVEEEFLATLAFFVVHAVPAEDAQIANLAGDHAIAPATMSASTCGFTSWTRRIVAPRSNAATAAATLAPSRSSDPVNRRRELLREKPTSTGRPSASRTSSRRTSSRLCATVLPNPIPGSRQIRSSGMPSETANASRSSRNEATSVATSS